MGNDTAGAATAMTDHHSAKQTFHPLTRRAFALGLTATAGAVAGCGELLSGEKSIRYEFASLDGSSYDVTLSVLAADDAEVELRWEDRDPVQADVTDEDLVEMDLDRAGTLTGVEPLGEPLETETLVVESETQTRDAFESVPRSAGLLAVGENTDTGLILATGSWQCPSGTVRELSVDFVEDRMASLGTTCVA